MIINIHFGQARAAQCVDGTPVKMYHRHVTPKKQVGPYRSDELGNIEVTDPEDIIDLGAPTNVDGQLRGLGYPRYVGDGTAPVKREDLEFFLEPLGSERHRPLTEAEWAEHQEAVYQAYLKAAGEDAGAERLDLAHLDRYLATIEGVYGRSLTDVEARPFRALLEG